jgi:hypothetical protein
MLKKLFNALLLLLLPVLQSAAQEFNCKVTINHDKITGVDNEVYVSLQRSLTEFMNNRKWGNDEYAPAERIDCNIFLTLTANKVGGDVDVYNATLSIQASRPVYNTGYITAIANYVDRDLSFKYNQFTTLQFDDNRVSGTEPIISNLTAVFAYYAYTILALDYDSFSPDGGTAFLKKAQNVVNNAPEQKTISGWKAVDGTRNRYWLIDQLMNSRFHDVRSFWYSMHREGLDSMYTKPNNSRERILTGLKKLYTVNRENPSSMLMQFIFATKSEEFIHLLAQTPKNERNQYIVLLNALDVPNAAKYNAMK